MAAESNQHENNSFHVVTHITLKWNVTLTLGIRVACNWAEVKLFKWHHFVRFQLVHTIGGFMMTVTWAKAILRVIKMDLLQQIHQLFPLCSSSSQETALKSWLIWSLADICVIFLSFFLLASSYNAGFFYHAMMIRV